MSKGLEGVVAAETAISTVGLEEIGLNYRGYSINHLAKQCILFEEVAYLLLIGELPNWKELNEFTKRIASHRQIPDPLKLILESIPRSAHPIDVLRTGCSALGAIEPEPFQTGSMNFDKHQQLETSVRILGLFPGILFYWYHYHFNGLRIETCTTAPSIAEYLFQLLFSNQPQSFQSLSPEVVRALNVSLILYADHDLNASTFAARVTASTLSDLYSSITTAIGTLRGPLHGGASEAAMKLLMSINSTEGVEQKLQQMIQKKQLVMGFGHRIYKKGDPRSDIIKEWAERLNNLSINQSSKLLSIAESVEKWMVSNKCMHPNLDFYTSVVYHLSGIPIQFFTPVFAISRLTGWIAHIFEQRLNNRLIRPSGLYIGPPQRPFNAIENRLDESIETSRL